MADLKISEQPVVETIDPANGGFLLAFIDGTFKRFNVKSWFGNLFASPTEVSAGTVTDKVVSPKDVKTVVDTAVSSVAQSTAESLININTTLSGKLNTTDTVGSVSEVTASGSLTKFVNPRILFDYIANKFADTVTTNAGTASGVAVTPKGLADWLTAKKATDTEAQAGTVTDKVTTPASVKVFFDNAIKIFKPTRYDVAVVTPTNGTSVTLDLNVAQVFVVDGTASRTLTLTNLPGAGRSMTVLVRVNGTGGTITWPAPGGTAITWDDGNAPKLGATRTIVTLFFDGTTWNGFTTSSL